MALRPFTAIPKDLREWTRWIKEALIDGSVSTSQLEDNSVTVAKLAQLGALSVLANATNATANVAGVAAASDNTVLRRSGTALSFGALTSGMFPATVVPDSALQSDVAIISSGSFTGTLTGCTTTPTTTFNYKKVGSVVLLWTTANLFATSNSNACTVTGAPAAIFPAAATNQVAWVQDNTATAVGSVSMSLAGVLTMTVSAATAFTAAGTKGLYAGSWVYSL